MSRMEELDMQANVKHPRIAIADERSAQGKALLTYLGTLDIK